MMLTQIGQGESARIMAIDYTKGYMRVGGDRSWFNTLEGFFGTYAPPYAPAIFLLPFSLVVFYYILKKERNILKKEKDEE